MPIPENSNLWFARDTLRDFVDAVALARTIAEHDRHGYSFTIAQRAAFNEAVSAWCILFGSDHVEHQPIHWKNQFEVDRFRAELLEHVGLSFDGWREYRAKVVDYRNDLVAHRALRPRPGFHPNFDTALLAADYYHERLREKVAAAGGELGGPTLMIQFGDRLGLCQRQMAVAIAAVKGA